jgi:hypothetical protein
MVVVLTSYVRIQSRCHSSRYCRRTWPGSTLGYILFEGTIYLSECTMHKVLGS